MNDFAAEPLTPEEERVRAAVKGLPAPAPGAEFRELLRTEFTSGHFRERVPGIASAAAGRSRASLPWYASPRARWAGVPLAFAALLIAASVLNRGPDWTVSSATGLGVALVDGQPVPMNHVEELERVLRPGTRVRVPDGASLEIMGPGQMVVQLAPGTDLTIPATSGRWWGRHASAEVRSGELRITTGPRFHGARLAITTPAAVVEVTGTTLAVICDPEGTCVCVLEGRVRVGPRDGPMADVEQGHLRFTYNDGRDPKVAGMRENEAIELGRLREARGPALR
jgi:ferric-dicitrate binding protein FerR (iron transport regulator)